MGICTKNSHLAVCQTANKRPEESTLAVSVLLLSGS